MGVDVWNLVAEDCHIDSGYFVHLAESFRHGAYVVHERRCEGRIDIIQMVEVVIQADDKPPGETPIIIESDSGHGQFSDRIP